MFVHVLTQVCMLKKQKDNVNINTYNNNNNITIYYGILMEKQSLMMAGLVCSKGSKVHMKKNCLDS